MRFVERLVTRCPRLEEWAVRLGYLEEHWTLRLNRYQRDNLLWLLGALGYALPPIEPFHLAHTGDWVGELVTALDGVRRPPHRMNKSRERLGQEVNEWRWAPIPESLTPILVETEGLVMPVPLSDKPKTKRKRSKVVEIGQNATSARTRKKREK